MTSIPFGAVRSGDAARSSSHSRPSVVVPDPESAPQDRRVLVATADPQLLDQILLLAAASSLEVEVADHVGRIRATWSTAPLILVGADLAGALARVAPPRRSQVLIVGDAPVAAATWQAAVALGVDHVVELPEGERWLADRLGDAGDGPHRHGRVIGVVGSRGGAGASTLAAGIALSAAAHGHSTLLIDADPWAGGLDVLLGAESEPGLRWPDLTAARGRVAVPSFAHALPRVQGVAVVSWDRREATPSAAALAAVVDAGRRGFDVVVIDLARALLRPLPSGHVSVGASGEETSHASESAPALDTVITVVPTEVRAVTAAAQILPRVRDICGDVRVAVRTLPASMVDAGLVMEALDCRVAVEVADDAALTASVDEGEPQLVGDRSAIGRAALQILRQLDLVSDRAVSGAA